MRWILLVFFVASTACRSPAAGTAHVTGPATLANDVAADVTQDAFAADSEDIAAETDLGPPVRTILQRPWFATHTRNLLLDGLEATDNSWGYFSGIFLPTSLDRSFTLRPAYLYSDTPVGVSQPLAIVFPATGDVAQSSSRIAVAPFTGSKTPVQAGIWLSARGANDAVVNFPSQVGVSVAILPADATETGKVLLEEDDTPMQLRVSGRWRHFALPSPVSLPNGGWFEVSVTPAFASVWLTAPEVFPVDPNAVKGKSHHTAPISHDDRAAIAAYAQHLQRTPPETIEQRHAVPPPPLER